MPSGWTDAKKEMGSKMEKRRGDRAGRTFASDQERAMARRSEPGRQRGFGPDMAEGKAIRDTAVGKAMGRFFRPGKAREADAAEARDAAFTEAMEAVEASPPVEEAVAAAPEESAAPETPPGMNLYVPETDGTIRYQPKGDPFEYRLLPDGTFQVIDPKTGAVKASAAKGSDTHQAFQDHYDAAMGTGDWKWQAPDVPDVPDVPAAPDAPADAPAMPADEEPSEEEKARRFREAEEDPGFDSEDPEDAAPPRPRVERGGSLGLGSYNEQEGRAEQARMLRGNREAVYGQMREFFGNGPGTSARPSGIPEPAARPPLRPASATPGSAEHLAREQDLSSLQRWLRDYGPGTADRPSEAAARRAFEAHKQ